MYDIYKSARDMSWQCLIKCTVRELPVRPVAVAKVYGVVCRFADSNALQGSTGLLSVIDDKPCIFIDNSQPAQRQRYTIAHELGHYLLGHLDGVPATDEREYAAERFAADLLMPALLAIWLGLRLSEIQGLRFRDVSEDGRIAISHVRVVVEGEYYDKQTTKNSSSTRTLIAPPEIIQLINNIPHESDDEYIINYERGGVYKRFKRIIRNAGLPDMTFHDLRHLNASVMLSLGVPDKYAMERGGWSTPSTLKAVYQHTFSDERRKIDTRIDDYFRTLYSEEK